MKFVKKRTAAIVLALLLGITSGAQDPAIREEHARLKEGANMNHTWIESDVNPF